MLLLTMTVVVLHETSQDICAALENSPRHAGYLASDNHSVTVQWSFFCNQCEITFNSRGPSKTLQDTLATSDIHSVFLH